MRQGRADHRDFRKLTQGRNRWKETILTRLPTASMQALKSQPLNLYSLAGESIFAEEVSSCRNLAVENRRAC
jgi:hypothetical protein